MADTEKFADIITADIGGTNGRFAVIRTNNDGFSVLENITYSCADFPNFAEMMKTFIKQASAHSINHAHLAIAGQTTHSQAQITNIGWQFTAHELQKATGLEKVSFMNDFAAVARAVPHLKPSEYKVIKSGVTDDSAPMSIMGPGTGFGVAQLLKVGTDYKVISSEGGHASFAPTTHLERDLWAHLKKATEHICIESVLSGRGLARIHNFLVEYAGSGPNGLTPQEISSAATTGELPSCVRAVQLFLSILGGVASDIALSHGGRGGVWIAGGIVPKIYEHIGNSDFLKRFGSKGIMSSYLTNIPIHVITDTNSALIGAAADWRGNQSSFMNAFEGA
ncbi:glucokinase [Kordiimonas sp. SCSIO 12610]|uniref:glucokinase n=1 Tax=Kordiimonas sp. SCSIO 12610 TaxID=2829597 RepID=UPI00210B5E81|nr:glucokinase [Kordiimonas sp. SCSIO 12610]UTW55845.1 glucokinase [Kordiimonas sp. SCSIO 12610]